jgi:hypothetical protein
VRRWGVIQWRDKMPFMLYKVTGNHYQRIRNIPIAGSKGPLASIARRCNVKSQCPFPWHASMTQIVEAINGSVGQEIIIDLKPSDREKVSLYRLCQIWGFSDADWTPLALLMECLFVDYKCINPNDFKASFDCHNTQRSVVGEFLYVHGGVNGGKWNWGQVGRVNGALLWPNAFKYLATELFKAMHLS